MPVSNSKRVSTKGLCRQPEMQGLSGAEKFLWRVHLQSCLRRGITCGITARTFLELTQRPCHYCGAPPNNLVPQPHHKGWLLANGVDRALNDAPYVGTNLVPCCKTCNSMKSALPPEEFLAHIERISTYQKI